MIYRSKPLRRTPLKRSQVPIKRSPLKRSTTPIAKKAKRKASWVVENGVRIFLKTGREVCVTDAAWDRRRVGCLNAFHSTCQCGCNQFIWPKYVWDAHHLHGRGRGRDDRLFVKGKPNLVPLIHDHHMEEHNQGWSKGELKWSSRESE